MTIEEVKYDFTGHEDHFRNFFFKILKLIIISKLNCLESNETSAKYFNELINNIRNCKTHRVKYGKAILFAKFMQYEFTFQTIKVIIKVIEKDTINILFESIVPDFVKFFDDLSININTIKWNEIGNENDDNLSENNSNSSSSSNKIIKKDIKTIFHLLELFIESLFYLTTMSPTDNNNNNSLMGKMIEIKDVSIIRKNLIIEILVDESMIILNLSPNKNNRISIILDNKHDTGKTIKEIILQGKKN
ncbi:MAG: hypothetical protein ACTHJ7_09250 [Candidatus Nitrosocosmicus sp.]